MHNCGIRTRNLVHTFRSQYHYAASVNTSVLQMSVIRLIFNRPCSPRSRHLAAGVGHTVRDQQHSALRPANWPAAACKCSSTGLQSGGTATGRFKNCLPVGANVPVTGTPGLGLPSGGPGWRCHGRRGRCGWSRAMCPTPAAR